MDTIRSNGCTPIIMGVVILSIDPISRIIRSDKMGPGSLNSMVFLEMGVRSMIVSIIGDRILEGDHLGFEVLDVCVRPIFFLE